MILVIDGLERSVRIERNLQMLVLNVLRGSRKRKSRFRALPNPPRQADRSEGRHRNLGRNGQNFTWGDFLMKNLGAVSGQHIDTIWLREFNHQWTRMKLQVPDGKRQLRLPIP